MSVTTTGYANVPPPAAVERLRVLCEDVLEPWRQALGGHPIVVNSAFRSYDVNRAAGGAKFSQHRDGEAADVVPAGDLDAAFRLLWHLAQDGTVVVDEAILYPLRRFIHVSYTRRRKNRGKFLVSTSAKRYTPWTPPP